MSKPFHIPLRNRERKIRAYAIVDQEDFELLGGFCWSLQGEGYVQRRLPGDKRQLLHREIMGLMPGDKLKVDHIDGNPLNCRKYNLRVATQGQNLQNRHGLDAKNTSGYRGVFWEEALQKWRARVTIERKDHNLGSFDDILEAAQIASDFRAEHMPFSADARMAA